VPTPPVSAKSQAVFRRRNQSDSRLALISRCSKMPYDFLRALHTARSGAQRVMIALVEGHGEAREFLVLAAAPRYAKGGVVECFP